MPLLFCLSATKQQKGKNRSISAGALGSTTYSAHALAMCKRILVPYLHSLAMATQSGSSFWLKRFKFLFFCRLPLPAWLPGCLATSLSAWYFSYYCRICCWVLGIAYFFYLCLLLFFWRFVCYYLLCCSNWWVCLKLCWTRWQTIVRVHVRVCDFSFAVSLVIQAQFYAVHCNPLIFILNLSYCCGLKFLHF